MRTTLDLPDDVHRLTRQLARDSGRSMGEVVADLVRAGLRPRPRSVGSGPRGLPVVSLGRPVTVEDVRSLDDEE